MFYKCLKTNCLEYPTNTFPLVLRDEDDDDAAPNDLECFLPYKIPYLLKTYSQCKNIFY